MQINILLRLHDLVIHQNLFMLLMKKMNGLLQLNQIQNFTQRNISQKCKGRASLKKMKADLDRQLEEKRRRLEGEEKLEEADVELRDYQMNVYEEREDQKKKRKKESSGLKKSKEIVKLGKRKREDFQRKKVIRIGCSIGSKNLGRIKIRVKGNASEEGDREEKVYGNDGRR
ncbi:unnamed protein product [Paramecium octaurelia]|uniref:Uncharacterized protein n=1 Tax=Paramecium octaurelia TaxID=43137 RepID=A0A8S1VBW0_PAROT|nr:unnamed protein product [Paramecium octaurelia]